MNRKYIHLAGLFTASAVLAGAAPVLGAHPVEKTSAALEAKGLSGSCGSKDMKDEKKGEAKKEAKDQKKGGKEGSCGAGSCGSKDMKKDKKGAKGEKKDGSCGSKDMKKDEKKG